MSVQISSKDIINVIMWYAIDTDLLYELGDGYLLEDELYKIYGRNLSSHYLINKDYNFIYRIPLADDHSSISPNRISKIDINVHTLMVNRTNMLNVNVYTNLLYLLCQNTNISDVSKLTNLIYLNCKCSKISDVNMLTNLIYLNCEDTDISDVSTLNELGELHCSNSNITDVSMLENLKHITLRYPYQYIKHKPNVKITYI
jgi:hypothetical protein